MKILSQDWVILFGGAGRENIVNRLLQEGECIRKIIMPDSGSTKLFDAKKYFVDLEIPVIVVKRNELDNVLETNEDANLLSIGFPYILSKKSIDSHRLSLNIHPTLLPKYRGPTTGPYILMNNEKISGSTVHIMSDVVDSGDIVLQSQVSIGQFDTVRSLQRKVYDTEPSLLIEAIKKLRSGFIPLPQEEHLATIYPKSRKPKDSQIDPTKSILELFNLIRACDPADYPAFFIYNGEKVCVRLWRPDKADEQYDEI